MMKGQTFNYNVVRSGLVLILYIHGITARHPIGFTTSRNHREIQEKVMTIREVEKIKQRILRTLGMHTEVPNTTQVTPVIKREYVTEPVYKRTEVRVYRSEIPENYTDVHIIQFNLPAILSDKSTEMASVNLLIRVKCSRKNKQKRNREMRSRSQKQLNDGPREAQKSTKADSKTDKRKSEQIRKRKTKRKLKNKLMIGLIVSNVTSDGKPGNTLASVNSTLKKTKTFNVALPIDKINQTLKANSTLQFYVQCVGCGRKASLILIHKNQKRKRANDKPKDLSKQLHKRRPKLLVESHITHSISKS